MFSLIACKNLIIENSFISFLFYIILIDIICGTGSAIKKKSMNSHIGLIGLIKHSIIILVVITMGLFAPIFKFELVFDGLLIFFIVQYGISIVENGLELGIPIPDFICERLKILEKQNSKFERNDRNDITKS